MHRATRVIAASLLAQASRGEAAASGPRLVVVSGPDEGRFVPLSDGDVLGRGRAAQVPLRDPAASRRHVRIEAGDGQLAIVDLGSKNGVELNGRRIRARATLRDGDRVGIGATVLEVAGLAEEVAGLALAGAPATALAPTAPAAIPRSRMRAAASALLLAAGGALIAAAM